MADSTRPPAPFLPPEIISRILLFLYPKRREHIWMDAEAFRGLSLLSRTGRAWKLEAQRRLFEEITIRTSIKLLKLAFVLESAPHLGHCIRSLVIVGWTASNPIVDAHLVFQLISSVPNLTSFSFDDPPFDSFSAADSTAMQLGPPLLPNLIKLNLNARKDQLWKCAVFDQIVGAAPNIEELKLEVSRVAYVGPVWSSTLPNLKKLTLTGDAAPVLMGRVWPLEQFRGLESLSIHYFTPWIEYMRNNFQFFETVGPSLVELSCDSLPAEFHPFLPVLESVNLSYLPFDQSSPPKLLLPPTITTLIITGWQGSAVPLDYGQMVKLQEIYFDVMIDFYDLSTLPFLKKLTLESCNNATVLDSMQHLEVGSIRIGELELLKIFDEDEDGEDIDDFDGADIRTRCEELGIKYTLTIRD